MEGLLSMGFKKGENPHHPRKGAAIKVDPIRDLAAIARIKYNLESEGKYRDLCLFTLGINTGWRANELLSIRVGDVEHLKDYDMLELKQSKNKKYRMTPLNPAARAAVQAWLKLYRDRYSAHYAQNAPLFMSMKYRRRALCVSSVNTLIKKWSQTVGVNGPIGSHSMRKTWGYHQRVTFGAALPLICRAYGHNSERETLSYIGILPDEIDDLYQNEL
jgi:integrase